jgi:hypothetical protein
MSWYKLEILELTRSVYRSFLNHSMTIMLITRYPNMKINMIKPIILSELNCPVLLYSINLIWNPKAMANLINASVMLLMAPLNTNF